MVDIHPDVMCHYLNINPKKKPISQNRRTMDRETYNAVKEKVEKLLKINFIREGHYPIWFTNTVSVKQPNAKWMTYTDYNDLNKAFLKDSFSLPLIDQLVDATIGHEILSFMDAYLGYNQNPMYDLNQEHTLFNFELKSLF